MGLAGAWWSGVGLPSRLSAVRLCSPAPRSCSSEVEQHTRNVPDRVQLPAGAPKQRHSTRSGSAPVLYTGEAVRLRRVAPSASSISGECARLLSGVSRVRFPGGTPRHGPIDYWLGRQPLTLQDADRYRVGSPHASTDGFGPGATNAGEKVQLLLGVPLGSDLGSGWSPKPTSSVRFVGRPPRSRSSTRAAAL